MAWIVVAATVASAAVGAYQQHQVAKKQENSIAAQLQQQKETESKVQQRNLQMISQQQGQTDQPQKSAAAKTYQDALAANQAQATAPLATVGAVSDAYKKSGSDAALGIASYGKQQGDLTASIDAPGLQRQQNRRSIDDYGLDVNDINRRQKDANNIDAMQFNSIHANPYVGLLTNVAKAYAGSRMGGGFSTPSTSLAGNAALGGVDLSYPGY